MKLDEARLATLAGIILTEGIVDTIATAINDFSKQNPNASWKDLYKFLDSKYNVNAGHVWDKKFPTYGLEYILFGGSSTTAVLQNVDKSNYASALSKDGLTYLKLGPKKQWWLRKW